ncbi:MAG: DNA polymerase III subunit gamma/tau, partial [Rhodopirellula sp. JB055]|uniref:DNA polymerase III subunit gamma/tau n=1 Tax=Rhodopirellula sp. JB055 TaxID=3342846 RepID=UPI00370A0C56
MSDDHSADNGSYVVVARRYRPRDFTQLVGQDHVARALQGAIETSRVGHAYLFTGARGVGKTSTARIFAKALNHPDGPTANPDNESDVAQAIDSGEDVDVIEIDGASNRGIDEIRSLRANVGVRPSRSRYKIYIIDEVHMLTGAAFNALLKTLEEPPEHVKFIFCTTDPEKLPITVLSRCQRFDFAPVESDKIVQRLREIVEAEDNTVEDEALESLARRAAGSMRDSQSLLEQVLSFSDGHLTAEHVHTMLGTADDQRLHRLAEAMAARDASAALMQIDDAIAAGVDSGRLAEQMLGYFRDLMAVAVGCEASLMRYAAASMHGVLSELANRWGLQTVLAIVG